MYKNVYKVRKYATNKSKTFKLNAFILSFKKYIFTDSSQPSAIGIQNGAGLETVVTNLCKNSHSKYTVESGRKTWGRIRKFLLVMKENIQNVCSISKIGDFLYLRAIIKGKKILDTFPLGARENTDI